LERVAKHHRVGVGPDDGEGRPANSVRSTTMPTDCGSFQRHVFGWKSSDIDPAARRLAERQKDLPWVRLRDHKSGGYFAFTTRTPT